MQGKLIVKCNGCRNCPKAFNEAPPRMSVLKPKKGGEKMKQGDKLIEQLHAIKVSQAVIARRQLLATKILLRVKKP